MVNNFIKSEVVSSMLRTLSKCCALVAAASLAAAPAWAGGRPYDPSRDWFGHIGGGWAFPQGDTGDVLDDDWTFSGGALYWPSAWPIGLSIEAAYTDFDLSSSAIRAINDAIDQDPNNDGNISGGGVDYWELGLNGIWSLSGGNGNGLYLTGGAGWYHVGGEVTQDGLVYYPPVCDPWFWWCYPGGVGPGTFVVGSTSTDEFGWNLGAGYSFNTYNGQFFIEAKYHQIQWENKNIEFIPLTIGFRW
jgi:hypothetical protein